MMKIHRSGYYAWLKQPKSLRQKDDERLLGLIKQFWLGRKMYKDREEARQDIFNYIEMFYNPTRRHGYNDDSPVEFERRHFM